MHKGKDPPRGGPKWLPEVQTILFGCPLELRTIGELKKIPLVLEYLLDDVPNQYIGGPLSYQV